MKIDLKRRETCDICPCKAIAPNPNCLNIKAILTELAQVEQKMMAVLPAFSFKRWTK